jgi:hypothetical protein
MTTNSTTGPGWTSDRSDVFKNNVKLAKRRGAIRPELFLIFPILFLVFRKNSSRQNEGRRSADSKASIGGVREEWLSA